MANVLLTPTLFTKLVLMNLGEGDLMITRNMSSEWSKEYGEKKEYKPGASFNVRKPQRYIGTDNLVYNPEPISDTSVQLTVDQVSGVHFQFDSLEKTLSLNEANDLARPAALAIATKVNARAAAYIAKNTFNVVGTPGTIQSTMLTYLTAEDKLIQLGMDQNTELNCVINRRMSSTFVDGSKALFNNSGIISEQQSKGRVVNQLGYNFQFDQTLYQHTTGIASGLPTLVKGASQVSAGGNNANGTLILDGLTASTLCAKAGDSFVIANVFSIHPQARISTQDLQQFTLMADLTADGTGTATAVIYPAITPVGVGTLNVQQQANVDSTPADNAVIKFWDGTSATASKVSTQGLLLNKDAFAFLSVPLEAPSEKGVEAVSQQTDPQTGITIRYVRTWDNTLSQHFNRFDVLYGFGRLYPELACRIAS